MTNFRFAYINWPSWKFISTLEFLYGSLEWRKVQNLEGLLFKYIIIIHSSFDMYENFKAYLVLMGQPYMVEMFFFIRIALELNNEKVLCWPSIYQFERKLGF